PVRNPYDVAWENPAPAQIVTYGYQRPSLEALADVVLGEVNPSGKLPVNVPTADGEGVLHEMGFGLSYDDDGEQPGPQPGPEPEFGFFLTNGWTGGKADHAFVYGRFTDEVLI